MTEQDFIQDMQNRGANFAPAGAPGQVSITNINLQKIRAAMLPSFMTELYKQCNGINLGTGYIFGLAEFGLPGKHPTPSIIQINQDLTNIPVLRGKTIFGRNDLFWFAFDAFGNCFMLDNINLKVLRKYDNPYQAMSDCLLGGKF